MPTLTRRQMAELDPYQFLAGAEDEPRGVPYLGYIIVDAEKSHAAQGDGDVD